LGIEQDYTQALAWYYKAAGQGNATAENQLGYMYQKGEGVAQDFVQALARYRAGAAQGDSNAQNNLRILTEKLQSDPALWASINASAQQAANAQAERRSQIISLRQRIAELEADARQQESMAATLERPGTGAVAAVENVLGAFGAANFRLEAQQYRYEAAQARQKLADLELQSASASASPAPPPPPTP
jgi:chromosome segregation ATPase